MSCIWSEGKVLRNLEIPIKVLNNVSLKIYQQTGIQQNNLKYNFHINTSFYITQFFLYSTTLKLKLKKQISIDYNIIIFREEATTASTAFCLRQEKDDQKVVLEDKDLEVIGSPIIKYGDSTVIMQHSESGLWLSYKSYETKKKGVGKVIIIKLLFFQKIYKHIIIDCINIMTQTSFEVVNTHKLITNMIQNQKEN